MSTEFSRIQISSGGIVFQNGTVEQNKYPVVFEEQMIGVPTVVLSSINTNQEAVAANVTRSGFDIILSMDWCNEPTKFEIHYQAFFVR